MTEKKDIVVEDVMAIFKKVAEDGIKGKNREDIVIPNLISDFHKAVKDSDKVDRDTAEYVMIKNTIEQIVEYVLHNELIIKRDEKIRKKHEKVYFKIEPIKCIACETVISEFKFKPIKVLDYKNKKWFPVLLTYCPDCNETFGLRNMKKVKRDER